MANMEVIKKPTFLLKVLELVLEIIMLGLMGGDMFAGNSLEKSFFSYGIMIGYIIISVIMIAGFILDHPLHATLILMITGPGAVMFITAGSLIVELYTMVPGAPDKLIAAGVFGFLTGAIYIVDTLLTFFRSV